MSELDRTLAALAAKQHSVISTGQIRQIGCTPSALRHRVETGAWERIGRRCLRLAGAPETWRQLLTVGLLDLGDEAVLAGRSAAALLGLDGFAEGAVELLVPRSVRNRTTVGSVRSAGVLHPIDRVTRDGFGCTSAALTIVQLAAHVTERELENAIDSSLRLGLTSETFLRHRLRELRHRGLTGVGMLDQVLDGAGGHSRLERMFLDLVRRAGLPMPSCQRIHHDAGRFVARTDFCFAPHAQLVVEVAGHGTHATRRQRQRDAQRQSELALLGLMMLTFTYEDIVERPAWVLGVVRRALLAAAT